MTTYTAIATRTEHDGLILTDKETGTTVVIPGPVEPCCTEIEVNWTFGDDDVAEDAETQITVGDGEIQIVRLYHYDRRDQITAALPEPEVEPIRNERTAAAYEAALAGLEGLRRAVALDPATVLGPEHAIVCAAVSTLQAIRDAR